MKRPPYNAPSGFRWILGLSGWKHSGTKLDALGRTSGGQEVRCSFEAISPEIWHYTMYPPGATPQTPTTMIVDAAREPQPLSVEESLEEIIVSGPRLALHIRRNLWSIRFAQEGGREVCGENPYDTDGLGRLFVLPLGYVQQGTRVAQVTQSFHLHQDEHLFGLGEKFTPLDKRGQRIVAWNVDALGSTSERSHKNIPLLISSRGYGLFLDTGARITWELGTVSAQSFTISVDSPVLDAYVIYGPSPAEILQRYADLTGHAPVPPKWSFGLWVSSGGTYRDRKSMEELIEGLDRHAIPADIVHIDPWWMKWRRYCDFRWDADSFPEAEKFIEDLHARNLKLCLWEHPYVSVESDLFEEGEKNGYFIKRPDGEAYVINYGLSLAPRPDGIARETTPENSWNAPVAIIDLTNAEACAWFQDLHRPVFRLGADVFKTDFGEDVPEDALFSNGETGATLHNLYSLLYNKAVHEVTRQEKGYGLVWSRSGTAGSQRYPVCWSGDPAADFDSLACTIRGGLSAGMSGIPFWSNDIGSYRGVPSPRLYVRWAQFGLLCSHSRMHGDSPREPWQFGDEALGIVRRYIQLRYQLFPYLYSCAYEASRDGIPVLRAMPLAFPHDVNAYDKDLQFMLGPWLLVAPIYDETDERDIYLPEGRWINFWSDETHDGPSTIRVHAPLDVLPLFLRGGTILPLMPPARRIPEARIDPLIIELFPCGKSSYHLNEDEGSTLFTCEEEEKGLILGWKGDVPRQMIVRLRASRRPFRIIMQEPRDLTLTTGSSPVAGRAAWEIHVGSTSRAQLRMSLADPIN